MAKSSNRLGACVDSHEVIDNSGGAAVFQQDASDGVYDLVTLTARFDENTESARLAGNSSSRPLELIDMTATQTLVGNRL